MTNLNFLFAAYTAVWVLLFLYISVAVASESRRSTRRSKSCATCCSGASEPDRHAARSPLPDLPAPDAVGGQPAPALLLGALSAARPRQLGERALSHSRAAG